MQKVITNSNEETEKIMAIDVEISDSFSALLGNENTQKNFKFIKNDFYNYFVNDQPFKIVDRKIKFDESEYQITLFFF